ncbi:hypothetical protein A3K29_04090 [Candidatus Collierbacteria bacterium RIFOXYB2_FULL_46_14]|nr:MAG: hypothetical protein A3K29_04090 [Candidatus Collierbacteria bacterium RIFOXYB2_FULL_46_14]OGD76328.1 MAG: hypothetical protein A3K43_04090 [Candidatus Collierbacteria bacterium RIFOXYA2_FULL_46_20]OGD77664.1 MAG: hypothetical protein A3K39_04090 [Candidatus Collierbacteria bacterium RIFOXYC2_FULL_43_15]OGD80954.1 MAG: hypothetical protein A2320_04585 [Pseudomonadales bacterium GWC2_63_15]OGD82386.1 MAG: hypothetical protein A3K36_04090 [Candidatus Collierbacteria bacterium RIFOXYD2_FUL
MNIRMFIRAVCVSITIFSLSFVFPQKILAVDGLIYQSGISIGGSGVDWAKVKTDFDGNTYIFGYFSTTVDFDPTVGVDSYTSAGGYDMFLSKYDSGGNYLWTKVWGGAGTFDDYNSLTFDTDNNVYVTGEFESTVDFDPGAGTDNHTANGLDGFLTKYDSNGNHQWTKTWGGDSHDRPEIVSFNNDYTNIYVYGRFFSTPDFDPGAGTDNHTSNGGYDIFLTKFDLSGNHVWTKTFGGSNHDYSDQIYFDANNNFYLLGDFFNTVDFDPGSGTDNRTSNGSYDNFISKFDADGNFLWVKNWGGSGTDRAMGFTFVGDRILISGIFVTTVDFDPGSGTQNKTVGGSSDIYILELSLDGNFKSIKTVGGSGVDEAYNITKDVNNNLYIWGIFSNTIDFDSSESVDNHVSNGLYDLYLTKYDSDLNYQWTRTWGGTGYDYPTFIDIYSNTFHVSGAFANTMNFNGDNNSEPHTSNGSTDIFMLTYTLDITPPVSFKMISPVDYTNDNKPVLVFNKSSDTNGISSYSVNFDRDKHRNFVISGLPASGNGQQDYVHLDDSNYKVTYRNENDSDSGNDEITVLIKGFEPNFLSEGAHSWSVTAYDSELNERVVSNNVYLDKTNPEIKSLAIQGLGSITPGKTYRLKSQFRNPVFSGTAFDKFMGSTKTNSDGTTDTFESVASGPKTVSIDIKKQGAYKKYYDYSLTSAELANILSDSLTKYTTFSLTPSKPLVNGLYKVVIEVTDLSNNKLTMSPFYLSYSSGSYTTNPEVTPLQTEDTDVPEATPVTSVVAPVLSNNQSTIFSKTQDIISKICNLIVGIFK